MRKFLEKSSHDAVITVFILAQKGKMSTEWTIVPGELKKPLDVKNPSDSKYLIFINVSRREVHEILVFKHQKLVFSWFEGGLKKTLIIFLAYKG